VTKSTTKSKTRSIEDLSRKPEEESVESVFFIGFFFGSLAFIPLFFFFIRYWFSLEQNFGVAGVVGVVAGLYCTVILCVSCPFALRDLHSRDQRVLFLKIASLLGVGVPIAGAIGFLNEYLLDPLANILWKYDIIGWLFLIEAFGLLAVVKIFLGKRISRWYHLKPISEGARQRQIEKCLADADRHLKKNEFEGASQMYHSVAQIYLSLKEWTNSAKYYFLAAETLSKDSSRLSYGVALLYAISASAYLLSNDSEKFNTSSTLAKGLSGKETDNVDIREQLFSRDALSPKGSISFILDILNSIQKRETQQLRKNWSRIARTIDINFGPYAEELAILLKKNLDVTT
jgi:hypothetical protein